MASEELARKLERRLRREEAEESGPQLAPLGAPAPESEPPARAPTASADAELSAQLSRRLDINEGAARPRRCRVFNPYTEFPEFSRRLIKDLESMFKLYDAGRDGFIDLMELKLMMEKLGAPQTHLGLKSMIKEVDEDFDGKLSFRELGRHSLLETVFAATLVLHFQLLKRSCSFSTRPRRGSCRRTVGSWRWQSSPRSMWPWKASKVPRTSLKPRSKPCHRPVSLKRS
uniref:EF-hand domain family member D1 n=1 Tax=Macaca mulatta TaxID=9544 RepID=A0A5F7ZT59_MACMU